MFYVLLPEGTKIGPFLTPGEAGQWVRGSVFSTEEARLSR